MAVNRSIANKGQKTHENKPSSKLAKQSYVTKPEARHGFKHSYNLSSAESQVKKLS